MDISSIKVPNGNTYTFKDVVARKRMTDIIWSNLVSLRNNNQLIPGMQYRITDYHCTTSQKYTRSANHQFDIIVTADSTNKLNESARAIQHNGDTYFSSCNLAAWKIWYCLDNNSKRFAWADSTNGRGVIYRMIDEYNNDCPYDFKNILFIRYYSQYTINNYGYEYMCWDDSLKDNGGITSVDTTKNKYLYTFSYDGNNNITDASLNLNTSSICKNNIIDIAYMNITIDYNVHSSIMFLNNIIIINSNGSTMDYANSCINNKFGQDCFNCTLFMCSNNIFGNRCDNILLGRCDQNTFSVKCKYIYLVPDSIGNTFGEGCTDIYAPLGFKNNKFDICCTDIKCNFSYSTVNGNGIYSTNDKDVYNNITMFFNGQDDYNLNVDLSKYLKASEYYPQFIGKNSNGEIASYTLADIINS